MVRSLYSRSACLLSLALLFLSTVFQPAYAQWTKVGDTFSVYRTEAQYVYADGAIYVFGGLRYPYVVADCLTLNTADPQAWTTKDPMPLYRAGGYAAYYNGKIYLVGGIMSRAFKDEFIYLFNTTVTEYDPDTQVFTKKADIPHPTYLSPGAVIGSKIYLIGGRTQNTGDPTTTDLTDRVQIYDMATDTWTVSNKAPFMDFTPMAAAVGNTLYYFSNRSAGKPYGYKGIVGDTIEWVPIADCPKKLFGAAVGVMGNRVYITGGVSSTGEKNTDTYSYDTETDTWTALGPQLPEHGTSVPVMPCDGNWLYYISGTGNFNTYRLSPTVSDVIETARQQPSMHIYPNPASGVAVVELPDNTLPCTISLLSILGDEVLTQTTADKQAVLNIHNLPAGMYTVRYTQGHSVLYRPLVIR